MTMATILDTQTIASYLEEGTSQAQRLMQLLHDERAVISANEGAALESIAENKEKLAQEIQASTQLFIQRLQQAGYSADNQGLIDYFQSCAEEQANDFEATWKKLQALLKECQNENRINGKLLGSSQRRIKQALSILQGTPVDEDLYGRGGESITPSAGNSLTHA